MYLIYFYKHYVNSIRYCLYPLNVTADVLIKAATRPTFTVGNAGKKPRHCINFKRAVQFISCSCFSSNQLRNETTWQKQDKSKKKGEGHRYPLSVPTLILNCVLLNTFYLHCQNKCLKNYGCQNAFFSSSFVYSTEF